MGKPAPSSSPFTCFLGPRVQQPRDVVISKHAGKKETPEGCERAVDPRPRELSTVENRGCRPQHRQGGETRDVTTQPCSVGRAPQASGRLPFPVHYRDENRRPRGHSQWGDWCLCELAGRPLRSLPCCGLGTHRGTERIAGPPNSFDLLIHKHFFDSLSSVLDPKHNVNQESYAPCPESGLAGEPDTNVQDNCRPTLGCREQGG